MKIRNIALGILALSLVGGATAGADDIVQTWKGKKVGVQVNGSVLDGGGIQIDGKTYLPIRAMADTLQALIKAESDVVHIYKPNVHLLLFTGKKDAMTPFGNVFLGTYEFSVFAQVDNLKTKVHSLKTTVVDPSGQTVDTQVYKMSDENRDAFWYTTSAFKIDFKSTGQYKVKFFIKQSEDNEFELISEKAILAMKKE
ncbi:copper amine oxidase [Paenibacillus sp.]|uniref:copper amine oxidase n=1 Tax=Paenibacillus sp. TaxID=58172 RepID=UPI002D3B4CF4|nr:copper amine oxidase [Paenibacillus sp.]HZG56664.1 copper amine oxidase [Paenibacillus sp.]